LPTLVERIIIVMICFSQTTPTPAGRRILCCWKRCRRPSRAWSRGSEATSTNRRPRTRWSQWRHSLGPPRRRRRASNAGKCHAAASPLGRHRHSHHSNDKI